MASGNENVVKIIGVICDFVRDAENDYKATRCNIFGLSHEEYTVLSEAAKVSECSELLFWMHSHFLFIFQKYFVSAENYKSNSLCSQIENWFFVDLFEP